MLDKTENLPIDEVSSQQLDHSLYIRKDTFHTMIYILNAKYNLGYMLPAFFFFSMYKHKQ